MCPTLAPSPCGWLTKQGATSVLSNSQARVAAGCWYGGFQWKDKE
jgi:hypothetical protein